MTQNPHISLSNGFFAHILNGGSQNNFPQPILQVVEQKEFSSGGRRRVALSDGNYVHPFCVLGSTEHTKTVNQYDIIKAIDYFVAPFGSESNSDLLVCLTNFVPHARSASIHGNPVNPRVGMAPGAGNNSTMNRRSNYETPVTSRTITGNSREPRNSTFEQFSQSGKIGPNSGIPQPPLARGSAGNKLFQHETDESNRSVQVDSVQGYGINTGMASHDFEAWNGQHSTQQYGTQDFNPTYNNYSSKQFQLQDFDQFGGPVPTSGSENSSWIADSNGPMGSVGRVAQSHRVYPTSQVAMGRDAEMRTISSHSNSNFERNSTGIPDLQGQVDVAIRNSLDYSDARNIRKSQIPLQVWNNADSGIGMMKQLPMSSGSSTKFTATGNVTGTGVTGLMNQNAGEFGREEPLQASEATVPDEDGFYPVTRLSPYLQDFKIKIRCLRKFPVRKYTNARGEGKVGSFLCIDQFGGQLKCTYFNKSLDRLDSLFDANGVFTIQRGRVVPANAKFSTVNNEFELILGEETEVQIMPDDGRILASAVQHQKFNELENLAAPCTVDIIGVAVAVGSLEDYTSKKGNLTFKKVIDLCDDSKKTIQVTFWGKSAADCQCTVGDILEVLDGQLGTFSGFSVSAGFSSVINLNPDNDRSFFLKGWYSSQLRTHDIRKFMTTLTSFARPGIDNAADNVRTIADIEYEKLGMNHNRPDFFTIQNVTVEKINAEHPYYPACGNTSVECKKKVELQQDGVYFCQKCGWKGKEKVFRYILNVNVCDATSACWLTVFEPEAQKLVGSMPADELDKVRQQSQDDYEALIEEFQMQVFNFVVKAKAESTTRGTTRSRKLALSVSKVDFAEECRIAIKDINALLG